MNYARDGFMNFLGGNEPYDKNYEPNSFGGPVPDPDPHYGIHREYVGGKIGRYDIYPREDDYIQPREFYNEVLSAEQKGRLHTNIINSLKGCHEVIRERATGQFCKVDSSLGNIIAAGVGVSHCH